MDSPCHPAHLARADAPKTPRLQALAADALGSAVLGIAALLWIPQAALLALALARLAAGGGLGSIAWPAAGFGLIGSGRALVEAWGTRRVFARGRAHLSTLRAGATASLSAASPCDRGRPPSGLAASVVAEQAEAVVPYLVRYQPARWRVMVVPPLILAVVASQSWVAAMILLVAAPLIPLFMAIVGLQAQAASRAQMVEMGTMNAFLLDRLRGLATLRTLHAVDATAARLGEAAQSLRHRTMAVLRIAFLSSAVLELFSALGVAMVAAFIGFHLLGDLNFGTWGHRLGLGQGFFVLLLAPAFFEPLRELSAVWHDCAAGKAALQALAGLDPSGMRLPGSTVVTETTRATTGPGVAVHALSFCHAGEAPLFGGLDLRVAPGEHVALWGASGSGKTALLSLLAGLMPADEGRIDIGGVPLTEASVGALRQRIGWMGQATHVFGASVEANIGLGRPGIGPRAIDEAIAFARLGGVAQAHPLAALGDGGQGLSGGEAVRLALARLAVDERADLLLVDEPTAHLDRDTAGRVGQALVELARGKTLIVATHDPVLAARMGRVIRLDLPARAQAA
jgi:ATP-binding cassette subfamily C protein CydD